MEQLITVTNRQHKVKLHTALLRRFATAALRSCLAVPGTGPAALPKLTRIEVTIISDRQMAAIHGQFLGKPETTDVLSFDYGEILISADTAARNASHYGASVDEEIGLYIVHGLLHLNGYDDTSAKKASVMRRVQRRLHKECFEQFRPSDARLRSVVQKSRID
jgi:probable rRNA maturation factor